MERLEGARWKVVLAARILLVIGIVGLASSSSRSFHRNIRLVKSSFPRGVLDLATAAGIIVGVLLIVLSFALARRNHAAYLLTQLLLFVSVALSVVKGLDLVQGLASLILFIALFLIRQEFYAKPVRTVITRALLVFGQLVLLSLAIGAALIIAPDRLFGGEVSFVKMLLTLLHGFVGLEGPIHFISHREQDIFDYSMAGLGLITVIAPILTLLQPSPPKPQMSEEDEAGLRELLREFGDRDSVGYFALREDKSVVWSNTRKAAITYRVVGGCALVSGDPIGNSCAK